jgi:beta-N-acetylhexosaminidase
MRDRRSSAISEGRAGCPAGHGHALGARLAAALIAVTGSAAPAQAAPPSAEQLDVGQLAGQRVVFAYAGTRPPDALVRRIERGRAAGVILFSHNLRSTAHLRRMLSRLQRAAMRSPVPSRLLVMVDQEGGPVRRLPGGPARSAAAVGATGSTAAAIADGRTAGAALRAVGANVDLAPVADTCRAGSALDGERRCYGRSPATVARLAGAFARGLGARGVAATLKHFPGFGAARVNTDFARQTIPAPLATLRGVDERPFATLAPRVELVMLSTAVYPSLSRRPAALSYAVATRELRDRIGFRGVSLTDALGTPALTGFGGAGRRAVEAARAGTDLALFGAGYGPGNRAARALARALRSGRLSRRAFGLSVERVLALRARLSR